MNNRLGRLSLLSLAAVMFLFAPGHAQQDSAAGQDSRSPKLHRTGARAVPNHYIVVLDQDAAGVAGDAAGSERRAAEMLQPLARSATFVYGHAMS